jgi:hypothetical protein
MEPRRKWRVRLVLISLIVFVIFTIALNIPFGSYRVTKPRFSYAWWLAIHAPIPFVLALRIVVFHLPSTIYILPWHVPLWTVLISIAAAVTGQLIGGRLTLFGDHGAIDVVEPPNDPTAVDVVELVKD